MVDLIKRDHSSKVKININLLLRYIDYLTLEIIVFILTIIWVRPNYVLAGGDVALPVYSWLNLYDKPFHVYKLGILLSLVFTPDLIWIAQWLFYFIILSLTSLSVYKLLKLITNGQTKIPLLIASMFCTFNPYVAQDLSSAVYYDAPLLVIAASIYLLNNFIMWGFSSKSIKYICNLLIASSLPSLLHHNFAIFVVSFFTILVFIFITVYLKLGLNSSILRKITVTISLFTVINVALAMWSYSDLIFKSNDIYIIAKTSLEEAKWTYVRSSILNVMRMYDMWSLNYQEYYNFDINLFNKNPFSIAIILFIALPLIYLKKLGNRNNQIFILCIYILLLLAIFLQKATNPPFGNIYSYLYNNVPYFWIFREPKFMWVIIICYTILLTYSLKLISEKATKVILKTILYITLTAFVFAPSWPLFTGQSIGSNPVTHEAMYVEVPKYLFEAQEWICSNAKTIETLLILPPMTHYMQLYRFNSSNYYGADFIQNIAKCVNNIYPRPIPTPYSGGYYTIKSELEKAVSFYNSIAEMNITFFFYLIKSNNVTHILYIYNKENVADKFMDYASKDMLLSIKECLRKESQFNTILVYRIVSDKCINKDYSPNIYISFRFRTEEDITPFRKSTPEIMFGSKIVIALINNTLVYMTYNTNTWGWKTLESPLIPVSNNTIYRIVLEICTCNAYEPHIKVREYDALLRDLNVKYLGNVYSKSWTKFFFTYEPSSGVAFIRLSIWHGHESPLPDPNSIQIKSITVIAINKTLANIIIN